jgi:hypothetical protein
MSYQNNLKKLEASLRDITKALNFEVDKVRWDKSIPSELSLESLQDCLQYFEVLGQKTHTTADLIGDKTSIKSQKYLQKCIASYNYLSRIFNNQINLRKTKNIDDDPDYWVNPC